MVKFFYRLAGWIAHVVSFARDAVCSNATVIVSTNALNPIYWRHEPRHPETEKTFPGHETLHGEDMLLANGSHFAGYTVVRHLGGGGMANAYTALSKGGAVVTLKVPRRTIAALELWTYFAAECDNLTVLDDACPEHLPHLVAAGVEASVPFLAMEYIDGMTAEEVLEAHLPTGLPFETVAAIGVQLCQALRAMHARKRLHLDVKPGNIVLKKNGTVALIDLGLAREPGVTEACIGTPIFASPEQLEYKYCDELSDVYGLGMTLYLLLTNVVPFESDLSVMQIIFAKRDTGIPCVSDCVDVPTALADIIFDATRHSPARRPTLDDLEAVLRVFASSDASIGAELLAA